MDDTPVPPTAAEPAMTWGIAFAVVAAVAEAVRTVQETGQLSVWSAVTVGLPVVLAALIRSKVIPAPVVRQMLVRYQDARAVTDRLADRLDVAGQDRPA